MPPQEICYLRARERENLVVFQRGAWLTVCSPRWDRGENRTSTIGSLKFRDRDKAWKFHAALDRVFLANSRGPDTAILSRVMSSNTTYRLHPPTNHLDTLSLFTDTFFHLLTNNSSKLELRDPNVSRVKDNFLFHLIKSKSTSVPSLPN